MIKHSEKPSQKAPFPLAYHITWGTYGTRLHGDQRGTVERQQNLYREPIVGADERWERVERSLLKFPSRELTLEQRGFVEQTIPSICKRGGWEFVICAAATDHVHCVLQASVDGKDLRKWLKRWTSEAMSERWPLQPGEVWWAECGSVKWVWMTDYFDRATDYVRRQRTTKA